MKQPIRKNIVKSHKIRVKKSKPKKHKNKFGTSKLEIKFKEEFLDKLGINYIYQYEIESIERTYDFYLPDSNLLIEVDGDYFHSNPMFYTEDKLTPTQKKNKRVDEYKNKWALMHGIPILRIWEYDINNNPKKVMDILKKHIDINTKKVLFLEEKKKRH